MSFVIFFLKPFSHQKMLIDTVAPWQDIHHCLFIDFFDSVDGSDIN